MSNALELIGCAFTPGGETPEDGFDCYGLVRYVRAHYFDLPTPIAGAERLERRNIASSARTVAATRASGAWYQVDPPGTPGDCVLLGRSASTPSHMGVALEAGVLHAFGGERSAGGSVLLTPWPRLARAFGTVEVWTCPRS